MDSKNCDTTAKLSMSEVTTYRWSFQQDVNNYRAAGYESIGVWRQKLADYGEEAGIELLSESGLSVSHLFWAGGFTGSDGRSLQEAIEDGIHAVRLAGALGAECLVVYPGGRNHHIYRHAERLFRIALESLLAHAEATDVVLAIEPMHPACAGAWTFLSDIESTVSLIESFDTSSLKLIYDTYHFGLDSALLANMREIVPHIALVQLGDLATPQSIDQERCLLGAGNVPLQQIIEELQEAGYDGTYDIELIGLDWQADDYQHLLHRSKETFESLAMPLLTK